jgi:hypothetical protein
VSAGWSIQPIEAGEADAAFELMRQLRPRLGG